MDVLAERAQAERQAGVIRQHKQQRLQLAMQINTIVARDNMRALEAAIEMGQPLEEAHAQCLGDGESWEKWVAKFLSISRRTADENRLLWRERDRIRDCKTKQESLKLLNQADSAGSKTSEGGEENDWVKAFNAAEKRLANVLKEMALLIDVPQHELDKVNCGIQSWLGKGKELAHKPYRQAQAPGPAKCKHCECEGFWVTTQKGKRMFVQPGGDKYKLVDNRLTAIEPGAWETEQTYSRHFCKESIEARNKK